MFGRAKTAWKLLGLATKANKAWKSGGGSAVTGAAAVAALDPKPIGEVVYGLLSFFLPDLNIPKDAAVTTFGILGGALIGWIIGFTKETGTAGVEKAVANRRAKKAAKTSPAANV